MNRPSVAVVTRRTTRKHRYIDYVGEAHLELLIQVGLLPTMIPVVPGTPLCLADYMKSMRGLIIAEGEDIEPKHYPAQPENYMYLEKTHHLKDEIEIQLLRHALQKELPVLGICRGSQLLNVVSGGTLFGDVQKEKKSRLKHIDFEHYDTYRHSISLTERTPLRNWYDRAELRVNSYHHQGVRDLAPRFKPMAHAKDGLIEAFYDPHADFLVGLQFHPERMLEEAEGNLHIWQAFGTAVGRRAR